MLSKYLRDLKVCVDFLCLDFGVQVDGSRNPVDEVLLLKLQHYFATILLQLIVYMRTVYLIVSQLAIYFDFAHRPSTLDSRF